MNKKMKLDKFKNEINRDFINLSKNEKMLRKMEMN